MRSIAALVGFALFVTADLQAANITLNKVMFPNTLGGTTGPTTAPSQAPLSQPIVLEFSGAPIFKESVSSAIRIAVDASNTKGQPIGLPAFGDFEIAGNRVIFRPRLPKSEVPDGFGPGSDIASDLGAPGLLPETIYSIQVEIGTPNSISNLTKSKVVLPLKFTTKAGTPGDQLVPSLFSNAPATPVKVDKKKLKPKDGTTGIDPNLFSDPAGLFDSIPNAKRPPFRLRFNGSVDPQSDNIGPENIRIRAIRDTDGSPVDEVLSSESVLVSNSPSGATVSVFPLSILPFGYTIAIELKDTFRSLLGVTQNDGTTTPAFKEVARYVVAKDPSVGQPIDDALSENFDNALRQDSSITVNEGLSMAGWDGNNSNVLKAGFGFSGDASLGRFDPPNVDITVNLDTDFQTFPLFSGATPEAQPGTVVAGGVFNFTDFHLPANVTLRIRGNNPVVIACTGNVLIEGTIDLDAADGTDDVTFDSAITPAPGGQGGPGGGKGGDGHPVIVPAGGTIKFMQTPQFGQSGFAPGNTGPGGGGGGQSGCTMPWTPFVGDPTCTAFDAAGDGSRGPGGGGGSFNKFFPNIGATQSGNQGPEPNGVLVSGRRGAVGIGDNLPVTFDPSKAIPNAPLAYFATNGNPTNAVARPNPNQTFEAAYNAGLVYDQTPKMLVSTSTWAKTKKILLFGDAGPGVFVDSDEGNNFVGPGGELSQIQGGQGGGGGGSRTEGLDQVCKNVIFTSLSLPFTTLDSKGAGGGGGGGAILIQALGTIEISGSNGKILATGGNGGGAEQIGNGERGGNGGGGAGGCVILQSASKVIVPNEGLLPLYHIDVSPGYGTDAATVLAGATTGIANGETRTLQVGDSGPGAPGLVQIHAPDTSEVVTSKIGAEINYSMFNIGSGGTVNDGLDPFNPLVPFDKTPTLLTPNSVARSTWYDLGSVTSEFRPPVVTSAGSLAGPIFGVPNEGPFFKGTDPQTGLVETDAAGNVLTPYANDLEVDSPDLLKPDFIPNGPSHYQTVKVEFMGADEDADNPGLPDESTATAWVTDPTQINGKRFVRWQMTFNIAANPNILPTPLTPRPQVNFLRIPFKY